jgi:hypothetical protein
MRKAEFNVPSEVMTAFAEELATRNLDNTIVGTTEEGEIIIEVNYERDETEEVDELETILAKLLAEIEEEDDEK